MANETTVSAIVTGVNVISIYVSDLERAKDFYVNVLGLQKSGDMPPGILLSAGDSTVYLEGGRSPGGKPDTESPCMSVCFAADSVKKAYEALKTEGVVMVGDYQEMAPTFAMFQCADPDGNVIEFAGSP